MWASPESGPKTLLRRRFQAFVARADKQVPIVVYCYHGHSSLGATAYLLDLGFAEVASLRGGFTAWQEADAPSEHEPA